MNSPDFPRDPTSPSRTPDSPLVTEHIPVLLEEVLQGLAIEPGAIVVDGTFGGGGHSAALLEAVGPTGRLIALDRDQVAIDRGRPRFADRENFMAVQGNFCDLAEILQERSIPQVHAIFLDLGLSSDQLAAGERGFSFEAEGELDLRFDMSQGEPAWRLVERLPEKDLANLIFRYGEERFSRRIARQVVAVRRRDPIRTARQMADLVRRCIPRTRGSRIHPATRTFQALRIAVNEELESLQRALASYPHVLAVAGRLAVISFHSLEDRLVKHAFRESSDYETLTKKPIRPNDSEIERNPRSRSARLRIARRVPLS